ncbi:serine/threonine-protein phosphatase 6 regulatory ankyrin repeat subunit C-like [Copidosoma floridanum]|uniref:serine/threonine-protein phosphatase 6 regulatory ankyrin repeat subunit C-like n=1 Tax=Copidosoma floridanum TaxID=29053 RepID=UPI000C6F5EDA|nr:serine/threonine-protein phosphatase 6 regulatory ankyrin repeat subunit C-like [Copidosoma floridanum]
MNNRNKQSIHDAVSSGDVAVVHEILQRNPSCVNDWNINYRTPLHLVCERISELDPVEADDELSIMALLLHYGADVNARRGLFFDSPLHFAVKSQQISKIKFLLDHKADPNVMNVLDKTALHLAVEGDNIVIIELLVTHKADINIVSSGDVAVVHEILQRNPSCVNDWNINYRTPLHLVCERISELDPVEADDELSIMALLLHYGADVNARRGLFFDSPLHFAVKSQQISKIKFLLDHKADPNVMNVLDKTALHLAVEEDNIVIIELLVTHKADINIGNYGDQTPLDIAIAHCSFDSLRLLVSFGNYNWNLHRAALGGDDVAVKIFIEEGADVDITNVFGDTPLHLVLQKLRNYYEELLCKKHNSIAELLIEHGRNLRKRNFIGETPLLLAQKLKDENLAKLLLKKITAVDDSGILRNQNKLGLQELNAAVALGDEKVVIQLLGTPGIDEEIQSYPQNVTRALFTAADKNNHRILKILLEASFRTDSVAMDRILVNIAESIPLTDKCLYLPIFYYAICLQTNDVHPDLMPVRGFFKLFALEKRHILDTAKKCLNELLEETLEPFDFVILPEILTGKILSHLNMYELRKLAK